MRPVPTFGFGRVILAALAVITAGPMLGELAEAPAREIVKSPGRLETKRSQPEAYGIQDYTVTKVSAIAFFPASEGEQYFTSGSLGRFGPTNTVMNFYAPLELPSGVLIDYIGLNSTTDAPNAIGVALYRRFSDGDVVTVGTFGSTVHDWATDYNAAPIGYGGGGFPASYIIHVQQGSFPTPQFFGQVEVWWKRRVFNPGTVSFSDVPSGDPLFDFVGALAASGITVGCGGGNFCPNQPLTRGQMAVFLAKALGLHWTTPGP